MDRKEIEVRYSPLEFRAEGGRTFVEAPVVRYNEFADVAGAFRERIMPGAFAPLSDEIRANLQHQRNVPLARNVEGGGLTLVDGPESLRASLELPDTAAGRDAVTLLRRKVLTGFSVEMRRVVDDWDGNDRTIRSATLAGIGLVDRPHGYADGDTTVAVRFVEAGCGRWLFR